MLSRVCWNCETLSRMDLVGEVSVMDVSYAGDPRYGIHGAFACQNCGYFSICMTTWHTDPRYGSSYTVDDIFGGYGSRWLPEFGVAKDFPDVPERIASAASEAHRCRAIGALRAAAQLARSVVEASAKEVGVVVKGIYSKIEKLYEERVIREHIKEAAHEIRLLGNDMAHGDFVDPITPEEADLALTLMDELLAEIFQSPARVRRAKEARLARKGESE